MSEQHPPTSRDHERGHRDPGRPANAWPPTGESAERLNALAALFGADGPPDLDEVTGPLHWPSLSAVECREQWWELRGWVDSLIERFSHLDHHVIPLCWWRHPGHVEALQALKDYERVCYSDTAPATAAVEWHRAFRDVEARLREWTGQLSCAARHEPAPTRLRPAVAVEWERFVDEDVTRRERAAINHALQAG